MMEEEFFS